MPTAIETQIRDRISSFVSELDVLVRKSTLEALHGVLGAGSPGAARRGRPAGSGRGPGRPKGAVAGAIDGAEEKIVSFVRANDGQGVREIAAATGIPLQAVKKVAVRL